MDDNKIIQSLWIGDYLSPMEILSIKSYLQNGHAFHLYTYNNIGNLPKGVCNQNANEIVDRSKIFIDSHYSVASFADYFRYKLLFEKGGWWVDLDTVCLSYFNIKADYCFATEKINENEGNVVSNAYIKSASGAEFLKECLEVIEETEFKEVIWGSFGPFFLQKVLDLYDSKGFILPPETFCPIYWYETYKLVTAQPDLTFTQSKAIHLWNERWRIENIDKNLTYDPLTLYERLKKRYGV